MWRCRTKTAPWAGRSRHTTVIDAAGAIDVIGGYSYDTDTVQQDVWASTDGGARPDSVRGGGRGVFEGVLQGGYSRGSLGIPRGFETGRPTHAFHTFTCAALPPSQDIYMQLLMPLHVWRACLSARMCACRFARSRAPACLPMRVCVRARANVCVRVRVRVRVCTACVNERCAQRV